MPEPLKERKSKIVEWSDTRKIFVSGGSAAITIPKKVIEEANIDIEKHQPFLVEVRLTPLVPIKKKR